LFRRAASTTCLGTSGIAVIPLCLTGHLGLTEVVPVLGLFAIWSSSGNSCNENCIRPLLWKECVFPVENDTVAFFYRIYSCRTRVSVSQGYHSPSLFMRVRPHPNAAFFYTAFVRTYPANNSLFRCFLPIFLRYFIHLLFLLVLVRHFYK